MEKCGHKEQDFGVTWPAPSAGGINTTTKVKIGTWFAGVQLSTRTCGGDCSHETFSFPREFEGRLPPDKDGLYFSCCKTAYKPYDLAVIVVLIIAKYYLKDKIKVRSDGTDNDWFDGKLLCSTVLDYGNTFELDK